ncbi:MAG TPA: hypothetical protein EYO31_08165 [Phycisphaerales bacterium]|nr:hypothetical protein [Phycisphaerales bacterium]
MTTMRHIKSTILIMIAGFLPSCQMYTPGGNPFTNGPDSAATYQSSEEFPKTVTLIDTRSGERLFVMEVPVGKKLVIDFVTDSGDNTVLTPDLMSWEVFSSNVAYGPLSNSMTVPNRWSRRIDVTMRDSSEYANPIVDRPLRVDEVNDQPDWWTAEGGNMDTSSPSNGYDP